MVLQSQLGSTSRFVDDISRWMPLIIDDQPLFCISFVGGWTLESLYPRCVFGKPMIRDLLKYPFRTCQETLMRMKLCCKTKWPFLRNPSTGCLSNQRWWCSFQQVHVEDNKSADWWQVPALLGRCRNWSKEQVLLPVWDMLIRIVPAVPYLVILIGMDNQMFGWSYALLWAHDLPTEELIDASICGMSPNGIWLRLPSRAGDEGQDFRTLLRAEHCKAPWTFVQSL